MANEVTANLFLRLASGNRLVERALGSKQFNTTAGTPRFVHAIIALSSTPTSLDMEGITAGWAWFFNHESSLYVQVGVDNSGFQPCFRIAAGAFACGQMEETPWAAAQTGVAEFEYFVIEK